MPAYDEVLAQKILLALQEIFPHRVSSPDLKLLPPFAEVTEAQLLLALDALLKLGLIGGRPLRAGYHSALHAAVDLEITQLGRDGLSPTVIRGATVTNFNLHGPNSRINMNSTDNSVNVASVSNDKMFLQMREAAQSISDESERAKILSRLDDLESTRGTSGFLPAYQTFMSVIADHVTVFAPFIPALAQMLS
jgi:hypothetical protein